FIYSTPHCTLVPLYVFFFTHTATTDIYTLSLHDALPISDQGISRGRPRGDRGCHRPAGRRDGRGHHRQGQRRGRADVAPALGARSEEHTSELQSRENLVCRLLLEKKKDIS